MTLGQFLDLLGSVSSAKVIILTYQLQTELNCRISIHPFLNCILVEVERQLAKERGSQERRVRGPG